jgi:anaerobic magnesium-protoporphyrin IX monomethyl ester cyclase
VIALINPYQSHLVSRLGKIYNRVWPPLSLANCAALLEQQGQKVKIIDANALRLPPEKVSHELAGCEKVFVSSSDLDRWQCPSIGIESFVDTVWNAAKVTEEIFVLGAHGTVKPKEILQITGARAVIRGEPELTVAEICRGTPLSKIKGVAYADGGGVIVTGEPQPVDLNTLPAPAFHLLPMERYHYEVLGSSFTLLEGSRGCASDCRFCLLQMYGLGVRRKKVERLIAEIELAISRFGVKTAYFMDLEFTVLRNQVLDLCKYLISKRYDFRWTCQTRFDLVDSHLLRQMKEAGCSLIHLGVEAGTNALLEKVNKQITTEQILEGMREIKKAKIDTACFFMLGFPGSDNDEIRETIRFAKRLNPTYALFHLAIPYPGTRLYEDVERSHPEIVRDALFPEACCCGEDLIHLKALIRQAYLEFYVRPGYVASRLTRGDLRSLAGQVKLLFGYVR